MLHVGIINKIMEENQAPVAYCRYFFNKIILRNDSSTATLINGFFQSHKIISFPITKQLLD